MIVSNSSFIGLPVVERAYANLGILYTAFFQIPIRFTMWSAGLALFTSVQQAGRVQKDYAASLRHCLRARLCYDAAEIDLPRLLRSKR